MATTSFEHSYEATASSVARARTAVARLAGASGADEEQLRSIRLAVSEAVTNAVLHGHRGGPGEVRVIARVVDGALWVIVRDDGQGLGSPSPMTGMGIGLGVIAEVADHMSVAPRPSGGTELRMRFDLAGGFDYAPSRALESAARTAASGAQRASTRSAAA